MQPAPHHRPALQMLLSWGAALGRCPDPNSNLDQNLNMNSNQIVNMNSNPNANPDPKPSPNQTCPPVSQYNVLQPESILQPALCELGSCPAQGLLFALFKLTATIFPSDSTPSAGPCLAAAFVLPLSPPASSPRCQGRG